MAPQHTEDQRFSLADRRLHAAAQTLGLRVQPPLLCAACAWHHCASASVRVGRGTRVISRQTMLSAELKVRMPTICCSDNGWREGAVCACGLWAYATSVGWTTCSPCACAAAKTPSARAGTVTARVPRRP